MYKSQRILWVRNIPEILICIFSFVILFYYGYKYRNKLLHTTKSSLLCILALILNTVYEAVWINELSFLGIIASLTVLYVSIIIILMPYRLKIRLLCIVTKVVIVTVLISLIGWFLFMVGVPLPHYLDTSDPYYIHEIYYLFNLNFSVDSIIPRFAGVFLEPGHLGTICIFILYINSFQLSNFGNIVLLAGALMSLSLAAYGLLAIAICIHFIQIKKILPLVLFGIIFIVGWIIAANYNYGDNVMYQLIYHRFEIKEGKMVGNNRTSSYFDDKFQKYCSSSQIIMGTGHDAFGSDENANQNITIGCAGYKRYFFIRGIIGSVLVLTILISYLSSHISKWSIGFLIIYIIANCIRDYPLKPIWLFLYILAIPVLGNYKKYMI